jgi:m7GpppX diphosphatase
MTAHETLPHRLESLEGFRVESVLNDGKESGVVALLGTFPGCATPAVVKLSRPPIPVGDPDALAAAVRLSERAPYSGMEYGYYHGVVDPAVMKSVSVDVLYPGCLAAETEEARAKLLNKHVSRNTAQAPKIFRETPASYKAKHVPYMQSIPTSALGWVYKILNKEKEVERLLYDDPDPTNGFLINVDPKWTDAPRHHKQRVARSRRGGERKRNAGDERDERDSR